MYLSMYVACAVVTMMGPTGHVGMGMRRGRPAAAAWASKNPRYVCYAMRPIT